MKKKNYLGKQDENRGIIMFGVFLVLAMILFGIIVVINKHQEKKDMEGIKSVEQLRNIIEKQVADVTTYAVYGNVLRLEGKLSEKITDYIVTSLRTVQIVLKDKEGDKYVYDVKYYISSEGIDFYFDEEQTINKGINLDEIEEGEYFAFLRITYSSTKTETGENYKYYTLKNLTEYIEDIEYYTTTDEEGNNRKIDLVFNTSKNVESYFTIISKNIAIESNIYDIVIDAGHGGNDVGASYGKEYESQYTLEYALLLKESLEKEGYRVKLTREIDERTPSYGTGGRAVLPYEVKAKLILSIHLNSDVIDVKDGGVEIYAANNLDLSFAKVIADNIVKYTGANYSFKTPNKKLDGVYVRTYSDNDVEEAKKYANEKNYDPYDSITTDTTYFFILRETGGISTKAYIDGRNLEIANNPYFNSNVGVESYLIELGYIISENDLNRLKEQKNDYITAITEAINSHYRSESKK